MTKLREVLALAIYEVKYEDLSDVSKQDVDEVLLAIKKAYEGCVPNKMAQHIIICDDPLGNCTCGFKKYNQAITETLKRMGEL